jgi:hypothetical protein
MATIKITQLPPIGNSLAPNTVLPVVNVAGTAATDKTTVGAIGNLILAGAGSANFAPAALANLAYSVANSYQPNITRVGNLNINTFKVTGGDNGQYLQTDGTGNLSFVSGGGSGNGVVGGANTQIQYNNAGNFGGSTGLTWNSSTGVLSTLKLSVSSNATIYGNTSLTNLNVAANFTTNNIFTDNYYYANGDPFSGGGNANTGNVTFNDVNIIGDGNLYLQPDPNNNGAYLDIYLTGGPDVHIAGNGETVIVGSDAGANVSVQASGNVAIQANAVFGGTPRTWMFDYFGNLTLPSNTFSINYANGTRVPLGGGGNANTGNIGFSNNVIYSNIGVVVNNSDLGNGQTAGMSIPVTGDGNTVSLYNTYGNVTLLAGNVGNSQSVQAWTFGADGNLTAPGSGFFAGQNLYVGEGANTLTQFNAATLVISANDTAYIQAVVTNVSDIGSADWVAYGHHGNDAGGWVDMGFTSASFSDANYTITGPGDGYVFAHGYSPGQAPTNGNGNLVLATGEQGNVKDIIFATSGFLAANEFMKISHANNALELTRAGASIAITDGVDGNIQSTGNVNITSNNNPWMFGTDGNLTLPDNTVIQNGGGIEFPATEGEWDLHSSNGKIYIGALPSSMAYIDTYDANISVRIRTLGNPEEGPGYDWIFDPTGNLTLPSNTFSINYANGHQVQLGGGANTGDWTFSGGYQSLPTNQDGGIYSQGTGNLSIYTNTGNLELFVNEQNGMLINTANGVRIYANSHSWLFDNSGNLRLPGVLLAQASDNGSIVFSNNGTDNNGSLKVDGGLNMTVSANSNFYVKRAGSDRLAITDTNTDLMASSNVVIHANKAGSEQNWTFDTTGKLTTPGDIDMFGGVISFHQQVGNINWGTNYMAFSQYGRVELNTNLYANANIIGANILNSNSVVVSGNANVSGNLVLSSTTQIVSTPGSNGNITLDPDGTGIVKILGNVSANYIISPAGSNGNITLDPDGTGVVNVIGNVVANNFSGNISITGNVQGTSPNVTLVAGSYSYVFDNTGNFTLPANSDIIMTGTNSILSAGGTTLLGGYSQVGGSYSTLGVKYPGAGTQFGITLQPTNDNTTAIQFLNAAGSSIGNIKQTSSTVQFVGDGSQLSNVATTTTGSWTLAAGTNTVSLSVPLNGVYSIWVRGNIPNGIVTYTATVVVSNPNTPVVGSSYGWYYAAGNALVLTAIPTQIVGTVNNISNAVVSTTTANVFTFGITNNSGTSQVVSYGYTELG